jgi:hypothetical protein
LAAQTYVRPGQGVSDDPLAVLRADLEELETSVAAWQTLAADLALDDYGVLRLVVAAVDDLPILPDAASPLRSVSSALHVGTWNPASRILAVVAALRVWGFNAVVHDLGSGSFAAGFPIGDDPRRYNSDLVTATVTVRRGGGRPEMVKFTWLLWSGAGRLGDVKQGGNLVLPLPDVLSGPQRNFNLADRQLPTFTLQAPEVHEVPVYGVDHRLAWYHHPPVADWLRLAPSMAFAEQLRHARQEAMVMDVGPSLRELAGRLDEVSFVNAVLRTLQKEVRYEIGPLRSLHDILQSREGDCDQLSLLLLAWLSESGFSTSDFRTLTWPGHLAVAVRSRTGAVPGESGYDVPGEGRFFPIDAAWYLTDDEGPATSWGHLNPRYAGLRPALGSV